VTNMREHDVVLASVLDEKARDDWRNRDAAFMLIKVVMIDLKYTRRV
jgi:hypothetical protein